MSRLKILQYNVRKSKKVMAPLLADKRTRSFDIIAIQEPWKNPEQNRTYCPSASGFIPAYDDRERRSCFLVNKELDSTAWDVSFPGPDLAILSIRTEELNIWIYSTYSEPPGGYQITQYQTPIPLLGDLLARDGEHVLLGDFNLHHPLWCGVRNPTVHAAAEPIVEITTQNGLTLASPKGETTWEARGSTSTIDLVFLSKALQDRLITCKVRPDLDFGSDHFPISTELELASVRIEQPRRRCWKKMDKGLVEASAEHIQEPYEELSTPRAIDSYTEYTIGFIQDLIEQTVPWGKPSKHGQPWWTEEVQEAVQEEREARRRHDHETQEKASLRKSRLILQEKRRHFREMVHEATQGEGIWKLAKWGKTSHGPVVLPVMPPLVTEEGTAYTIPEKAQALRARFYPKVEADLDDITDTTFTEETFPQALEVCQEVTADEIMALIRTRRANKAPGNDSIPNDFLKAMGLPLAKAVAAIATACWKTGHYPQRFRQARTVVLRKPGKESYETPGAWRPIALLNTIGKLIEAITAKRIQDVAERHGLFPSTQMGARKARSTETALELLTEQIHTVWKSPNHVGSMLSLDLSGAFDTVNPIRLLDILRKKGLPGWIVRWIRSFLNGRMTTLIIQGKETEPFEIEAGVPQGSTLSPILFLLYASGLLDICNQPKEKISAVGFADDTNIFTYGTSTEANCRTLERIHERCLEWARKHGMKFAPTKYELIHFTRSRTKFNLQASATFGNAEKPPSQDVRVLGVWLDTKLKWTAHARRLAKKASIQNGALTKLTASTWGASLTKSRQIYSSVVRPLLAYGAASWHIPSKDGKARGLAKTLGPLQNKCLRTVTGAYKATPTQALETEAFIPPIDLYLDGRAAAFQERLQRSEASEVVEEARRTIYRRLRLHRRKNIKSTPGEMREEWAKKREEELGEEKKKGARVLAAWTNRWEASGRRKWDQAYQPPSQAILTLHRKLQKAESAVLVQLRTGRVGLAYFLHKVGVPGYDSSLCSCGQADETPRHFLIYCPEGDGSREALGPPRDRTFLSLLGTPEGAQRTAKWALQSRRLRQFHVANDLLYG